MDRISDFSNGNIIKVHSRQIEDFKKIALGNTEKKRYRLCLQDSPGNRLHDMFLCRTRGDYSRPDKHIGIPESHTIIDGREVIVLFSDEGEVLDAFVLDRDGGYLSYRINTDIYHMTITLTDTAIDYEVKLGPFTPSNNIFPDWAPDGGNYEEAQAFLAAIERQVSDRLSVE